MGIRGFVDRLDSTAYQRMLSFSSDLLRFGTLFPKDEYEATEFLARYPWRGDYASPLPYGQQTPTIMWSGIYGIGANHSTLVLFVDSRAEDWLHSVLKEEFNTSLPDDFKVVQILPPIPQSSACMCRGRRSTLGADVFVPGGGRPAVLTAGHIATPVGELIQTESGNIFGEVIFTESPSSQPPAIARADVAVVEIHDNRQHEERSFKPGSPPYPGQGVSVIGADGRGRRTSINTAAHWIYSPQLGGRWGEIYVTDEVVSSDGDSGAPVTLEGNSIIGHVVGVIPDEGTLVQDLDYQLARAGVELL
jgi:hypothetical protein